MEIEMQTVYSEVYGILNVLGEKYINKLPKSLYDTILSQKRRDYVPRYDIKIPLEKQNLKKESVAMIALLHLNYWCSSREEKEELKKVFKTNEELHERESQEKNKEKYQDEISYISTSATLTMVEYKSESIFKKCINKIKRLLHIG